MPLLIYPLLVALLVSLIALKLTKESADMADEFAAKWHKRYLDTLSQYYNMNNNYNKAQLDNVFLRAELKRKHRRVPKL